MAGEATKTISVQSYDAAVAALEAAAEALEPSNRNHSELVIMPVRDRVRKALAALKGGQP